MNHVAIALLVGILIGALLVASILITCFRLTCQQCRKEHEHEVRIHDAE